MQKRSSKGNKNGDNGIAFDIMQQKAIEEGKNPAAVALGHLGGLKGGKARAEKLSAKKRREIAMKAANTRWEGYRK